MDKFEGKRTFNGLEYQTEVWEEDNGRWAYRVFVGSSWCMDAELSFDSRTAAEEAAFLDGHDRMYQLWPPK